MLLADGMEEEMAHQMVLVMEKVVAELLIFVFHLMHLQIVFLLVQVVAVVDGIVVTIIMVEKVVV